MKNVLVFYVSAPLFSNNMGCNALTYGTLNIFSEVAERIGVVFEYALVGNPEDGVIPNVLQDFKITLLERVPSFSLKSLMACLYKKQLSKLIRSRRILNKSAVVIGNSWGDSFSDIYGISRFREVISHYNIALDRKIPLVLLPQTIGPFEARNSKRPAKKILEGAQVICVRDTLSLACTKEIAPEAEVFESVDVALFMPYQKRVTSSSNKCTVALNPSGLLWKGGYTKNNQFNLKEYYPDLIRSIIISLLSRNDVNIELIGHDIRGPSAGNASDDYFVCKQLKNEFPECSISPFFYSPIEAKSYISGYDLLIGSRMHCCIAAYSTGIPVFPLSYSRKFNGFFRNKLDYFYGSDLRTDSKAQTLEHIDIWYENRKSVRQFMYEQTAKISEFKREIVDYLALKLKNII
jgi:colanic acid/amylovoran biosynthesis protein